VPTGLKNMTSSDPGEWLGQVAGIAKPPEPQDIFIRWWILVDPDSPSKIATRTSLVRRAKPGYNGSKAKTITNEVRK
jgi:hypothetical protein